MSVSIEKIDDFQSKIHVTIPPETYLPKVDIKLREQKKKSNLKGFRPGQVPLSYLKQIYGKSILVDEINTIIQHEMADFLKKNPINQIGEPITIQDPDVVYQWDFKDIFSFSFQLGTYLDFDCSIEPNKSFDDFKADIAPQDIEERVEELRNNLGDLEDFPRIEAQSVLYLQAQEIGKQGEGVEQALSSKFYIPLKHYVNKDFVNILMTLNKVGDSVDINLYEVFKNHLDLAAQFLKTDIKTLEQKKQSMIKITVLKIQVRKKALLDKPFFDKLFGAQKVKNKDEMYLEIEKELVEYAKMLSRENLIKQIKDYYVSKADVKLPDAFLKRWLKQANKALNDEQLEKEYPSFAESIKWDLLSSQLLKTENIEISKEDIMGWTRAKFLSQLNMNNQAGVDEKQLQQYVLQYLGQSDNVNKMNREVKNAKTIDLLLAKSIKKETKISYKKLMKLRQES